MSGSSRPSAYTKNLFLRRIRRTFLSLVLLAVAAVLSVIYLQPFPAPWKDLRWIPSRFLPESLRFERFSRDVFSAELSADTLDLHYTVADPSAYGLDSCEAALGNVSPDSLRRSSASAENYLSLLHTFSRNKLNAKEQLTYDIFEDYLNTRLEGSCFSLYQDPLGPTLGIQAQLPILFAEFPFRTKGDIEDYLALLAQIPAYYDSILCLEQARADQGLFMSDACAEAVLAQCRSFIEVPENNYLLTVFENRIDAFRNLTVDEKNAFKSRNSSLIYTAVIPAYESLIEGITTLMGKETNTMGLYYYPSGRDYYRYLIKSQTGDDRSIETIEEQIKTQLVADFASLQKLLAEYNGTSSARKETTEEEETSLEEEPVSSQSLARTELEEAAAILEQETIVSGLSPEEILSELRRKIQEDFPLLPDVTCKVKYVDRSMQEYLSPAFYLTPAIDNYQDNVIYINPSGNIQGLDLYTTLAHEGYPGHLYQSVYFHSTSPELLRSILNFRGYTEGWATYVEMYSYGFWEKDPVLAQLSRFHRSFTLGVASLLDIGIHYRGYTPEETGQFLEKLGFPQDTAATLYQSILEAPGNYLNYYVGYLNFCDLRDYTKTLMGDTFTLKKYHTLILDAGPAPFSILKDYIQKNI